MNKKKFTPRIVHREWKAGRPSVHTHREQSLTAEHDLPVSDTIRIFVGPADFQWIDICLHTDYRTKSDMPFYVLVRSGNGMRIEPEVSNCIKVGVPW